MNESPAKKRPVASAAVGILGGVLLLCACSGACAPSKKKPDLSVDFAEVERGVNGLIELGTIQKIDTKSSEVFVARSHWAKLNIDQRTSLGATTAMYCGHKNGTNQYESYLMDFSTGKQLAKWRKGFGYTGYE